MPLDFAVYQIYPRSYCDSNGDGIGDLAGIAKRLHHVADLGATHAIINPFYLSGGKDGGYDPINHRKVGPEFGDIKDATRLTRLADRLGIQLICDLVAAHVSNRHSWFREVLENPRSAKADYFVIAPPGRDGGPPNNWLSVFGREDAKPAWSRLPDGRYYLHHFYPEQPKLNLRHPVVREDIFRTAHFWRDVGFRGLRVDAIDYFFHDPQLRSNPVLPPDQRPSAKPFASQLHINDMTLTRDRMEETLAFTRNLRRIVGSIGVIIPELSSQDAPMTASERIALLSTKGACDAAYSLALARQPTLNARLYKDIHDRLAATSPDSRQGRICWATQCHDERRREQSPQQAELYFIQSLVLPGPKYIYYGEELGLKNIPKPPGDNDPYGRTVARAPMAWNAKEPNHGFTTGKPWVPAGSDYADKAVDVEWRDPNSNLCRYQRALQFWRDNRTFLSDSRSQMSIEGPLSIVVRHNDKRSMSFVINTTPDAKPLSFDRLPPVIGSPSMLTQRSGSFEHGGRGMTVPPMSVVMTEGPSLPDGWTPGQRIALAAPTVPLSRQILGERRVHL